jgi:type IV pilus assembly protein PilP
VIIMAKNKHRARLIAGFFAALCVIALACEDAPPETNERGGGRGGGAPVAAAAAPVEAEKVEDEGLVFKDDDFVESEHNRDPFRSYVSAFRSRGPEASGGGSTDQRPVIMPTTAVEEMRLIAIISGLTRPKAMLLDTLGVGYVVERGDYIGRAKVLQATGSVTMTLNWRVDRIRENEVVLTRQDPTDPTRPPLLRIISMRDGTTN